MLYMDPLYNGSFHNIAQSTSDTQAKQQNNSMHTSVRIKHNPGLDVLTLQSILIMIQNPLSQGDELIVKVRS